MPQFDTTKIEGFAEMTSEEKLTAILNIELPDAEHLEKEMLRYKEANSKANSKLAALKKQPVEPPAPVEPENNELFALHEEIRALKQENSISKYTAKYASMGFDAELAVKSATAAVMGEIEILIECQEQYISSVKKQVEKELVNNVAKPTSISQAITLSSADLQKMSTEERYKIFLENPEIYSSAAR